MGARGSIFTIFTIFDEISHYYDGKIFLKIYYVISQVDRYFRYKTVVGSGIKFCHQGTLSPGKNIFIKKPMEFKIVLYGK